MILKSSFLWRVPQLACYRWLSLGRLYQAFTTGCLAPIIGDGLCPFPLSPISPLLFFSTFLTKTLLIFYPSPLSQATYFPPFSSGLRQKTAWYVGKVLRQNREQGRVWGLCGPLSSGLMASCIYHCLHRIAFRRCAFPFCFVKQGPESLSAIPSPNTAAPDLTL